MRCDRCGKEIQATYQVAGHDGIYGRQCSLEIAQGRTYLIRKRPDQPTSEQIEQWENEPLPF